MPNTSKQFWERPSPPLSDPVWCISQFLDQLGLKLTEVRREGPRGNQIRIYQLHLDTLKFATQVLEHRQRQREEREKRRQQAQEDRLDYATRIQTFYGGKIVAPLH